MKAGGWNGWAAPLAGQPGKGGGIGQGSLGCILTPTPSYPAPTQAAWISTSDFAGSNLNCPIGLAGAYLAGAPRRAPLALK